MMRRAPPILAVGMMICGSPALACFDNYYAPAFLDVTDPTIGAGVVTIIVAAALATLRRSLATLVVMPLLFLGISYLGYWRYSGDCGEQIIQLNRYALIFATAWFGFEALKFIRRRATTTNGESRPSE